MGPANGQGLSHPHRDTAQPGSNLSASGTQCTKTTKNPNRIQDLPPPHLPLISLFAGQEESILNFFSFFSLSYSHFFSHSTLQVKVSEPQNSIDMNTENEHLKSIKMCLNQPTEWNLSFSAASLASCKVFNQNIKTDENKQIAAVLALLFCTLFLIFFLLNNKHLLH